MSYIKADNETEQKHFDYLEELRQSGDTNMFGAAPYLQKAFRLSRSEAREVLCKWMDLHKDKSRIMDKPVTKQKPHRMVTRLER